MYRILMFQAHKLGLGLVNNIYLRNSRSKITFIIENKLHVAYIKIKS